MHRPQGTIRERTRKRNNGRKQNSIPERRRRVKEARRQRFGIV